MSDRNVVPSDDTDQQLLDYNEKMPRMTDDDIAKNLHARAAKGEILLPHDHKFLSEYHAKQWTGDDPYDGIDKD